MGSMKAVKPLVPVTGVWRPNSKYPDEIKVPMGDGHILTYHLEVNQPHPAFQRVMDILHKPAGSYEFKTKEPGL